MSINGSGQAAPSADVPDNLAMESDDLPPGNHALEIAARRGIGPLSPAGREVWHGYTRPCVSCGQLAPRDDDACPECGQDLSEPMLEKMRACAGPWYVLEHVRPFPGVRFERLVRQIRRGVLTETSIVRGPTTDHQWRFAGETPGLSKYFGRCWDCHGEIEPADVYCPWCLAHVDDLPSAEVTYVPQQLPHVPVVPIVPVAVSGAPTADSLSSGVAETGISPAFILSGQPGNRAERSASASLADTALAVSSSAPVENAAALGDLRELSQVVTAARNTEPVRWDEGPPRIAGIRATWVVVLMLAACIAALVWVVRIRQDEAPPPKRPVPYGAVATPAAPAAEKMQENHRGTEARRRE